MDLYKLGWEGCECINLLKPGYVMHQQFKITFNNCTLCPPCIYVFCICLRSKQRFVQLRA